MAALVIFTFIYVGVILAYVLVSRYNAGAGGATGYSFTPLSLGEAKEAEHRIDYRTRQLTEEEWNGFVGVWQSIRVRFVDDPKVAVVYADLLISDLVANYAEGASRAGDRKVYEKYRIAHELARPGHTGPVTAEVLRRAMGLYSALFDDLVRSGSSHRP